MPCYHPLTAWKLFDGSISFKERGDIVQTLTLPCGQCIGCRLERSRQWAVRCSHEAQLHESNCFITLTYDPASVPAGGTLVYSHFQLFMKRYRKMFPLTKIRFYMSGEYGEDLLRPHYHACIFGHTFSDRVVHKKSDQGFFIYTSNQLSQLWPYGFSTVADFTFETAAYTARYITSKVNGSMAPDHYNSIDLITGELFLRVPEFNKMSLKPGIGALWYEKFHTDVYPHDRVVIRGSVSKPPKYYDRLLERSNPLLLEEIQFKRFQEFAPLSADNSPERLAVKETVKLASIRSLKRNTFKKD